MKSTWVCEACGHRGPVALRTCPFCLSTSVREEPGVSTPAARLRALSKLGPYRAVGEGPPPSSAVMEADPAAVRAWAATVGIEVSAKGRLKADVVERFLAAHEGKAS